MLVNMTEAEWMPLFRFTLGHVCPAARWAAAYWRDKAKAGETVNASIVNTTSVSGIYGTLARQTTAAKMGIAAFTIIAARELQRYGIR